jgi:hypothetical protein
MSKNQYDHLRRTIFWGAILTVASINVTSDKLRDRFYGFNAAWDLIYLTAVFSVFAYFALFKKVDDDSQHQ